MQIPLEIISIIFSYLPKKTRIVKISYVYSESYKIPATRMFFASKTIQNSEYTTWNTTSYPMRKYRLYIYRFTNKEYEFSGSFCIKCGNYILNLYKHNYITENILCNCIRI